MQTNKNKIGNYACYPLYPPFPLQKTMTINKNKQQVQIKIKQFKKIKDASKIASKQTKKV